jgi:hypothetical protein
MLVIEMSALLADTIGHIGGLETAHFLVWGTCWVSGCLLSRYNQRGSVVVITYVPYSEGPVFDCQETIYAFLFFSAAKSLINTSKCVRFEVL